MSPAFCSFRAPSVAVSGGTPSMFVISQRPLHGIRRRLVIAHLGNGLDHRWGDRVGVNIPVRVSAVAQRSAPQCPRARSAHSRMREHQNRPYVTSPSIARAHTGASSYCKERAFEHSERSEALAQVSPLAHHRGNDPRPNRYPSPLSSSRSRAALKAVARLGLSDRRNGNL